MSSTSNLSDSAAAPAPKVLARTLGMVMPLPMNQGCGRTRSSHIRLTDALNRRHSAFPPTTGRAVTRRRYQSPTSSSAGSQRPSFRDRRRPARLRRKRFTTLVRESPRATCASHTEALVPSSRSLPRPFAAHTRRCVTSHGPLGAIPAPRLSRNAAHHSQGDVSANVSVGEPCWAIVDRFTIDACPRPRSILRLMDFTSATTSPIESRIWRASVR
jgi:hypothetical protein